MRSDYFKYVVLTYIKFVQPLWNQSKSNNENNCLDVEFVIENPLNPQSPNAPTYFGPFFLIQLEMYT